LFIVKRVERIQVSGASDKFIAMNPSFFLSFAAPEAMAVGNLTRMISGD
jgi:hypothetical protein